MMNAEGARREGYRAVLFDLDGTLLDTIEDLGNSMNSVLSRFGFPGHDREAYKLFVGEGMENLVRRALPEARRREEATVAECLQAMREEYGARWKERTRPYEGIPELLTGLGDRGFRLTILSNKPDDFTKTMVKELLAEWHFEIVLGERPPIPRKPDPQAALEISRLLHIPPAEFLYLGDTATDMRTANGAGMYAVGVLWGFRKAEELTANGAKLLLSKPTDLFLGMMNAE